MRLPGVIEALREHDEEQIRDEQQQRLAARETEGERLRTQATIEELARQIVSTRLPAAPAKPRATWSSEGNVIRVSWPQVRS